MQLLCLYFLTPLFLRALTFEDMFEEIVNDLNIKNNENGFSMERSATDNLVILISYRYYPIDHKFITDFRTKLFSELKIKKSDSSTIACELFVQNSYLEFNSRLYFKNFLEKIQKKFEKPDLCINEISPNALFGIITERINQYDDKKFFNIQSNFRKEYLTYREGQIDDFNFRKVERRGHFCLLSNFDFTKRDFDLCYKNYDPKYHKLDKYKNFCCIVIKENNENKIKILNRFLLFIKNLTSKNHEFEYKISFDSNFEPEVLCKNYKVFENDKKLPFQCFTQKSEKITLEQLFSEKKYFNEDRKPELLIETNKFNLKFSIISEANNRAKNIIKNQYPLFLIQKILLFELIGLNKDKKIYFYKLSKDKNKDAQEKNFKIRVLVIFINSGKKYIYEYHYYEKIDQFLTLESLEKAKKSQEKFAVFFYNLKILLNMNNFNFYQNINIFYLMFLRPNFNFPNIKCFQTDILRFVSGMTYIDSVKKICKILFKKDLEYELYKFKCTDYFSLRYAFHSIFTYDDTKMITNLQKIENKKNLKFEKDCYFMLKNVKCHKMKLNLYLIPRFEKGFFNNYIFKETNTKLKKLYEDFISEVSNSLQSKNIVEIFKKNLNINFIENDEFLANNQWIYDFFKKYRNQKITKNFLLGLDEDSLEMFLDNEIFLFPQYQKKTIFLIFKDQRFFEHFHCEYPEELNYLESLRTSDCPESTIDRQKAPCIFQYSDKIVKIIHYLIQRFRAEAFGLIIEKSNTINILCYYQNHKINYTASKQIIFEYEDSEYIDFIEKRRKLRGEKKNYINLGNKNSLKSKNFTFFFL
ncbi:hypothetical protein GVAV_002754 [Gurleya vavrai]